LLLSTGFDGHRDDDMSGIRLSTEFYSWIMGQMIEAAARCCGGKIVSVLEGGYALHRLPELAANHVKLLLNAP
jgi:acetoin utilization deacetylase AcuC-like enzyme